MMTEKEFCRELAVVPELPPDLYGRINGAIRRRKVIFRTVLAIAATFICALGATGMIVLHHVPTQAVTPEVAEELLSIRSYVSGSDIDEAAAAYALYEGEETE